MDGKSTPNLALRALPACFPESVFPAAELFAYILTYGEIVVGIMLVFGALTHWASKFVIVVAVIALFAVHLSKGFFISDGGYEFILLILAAGLVTLTHGSGRYSVDEMYLKKM
jgi:putative oxidoreductase